MMSFVPRDSSQLARLARIEQEAFNMPKEACRGWIERTGIKEWRALLDSRGEPQGGMIRIPMGQWYGVEWSA